MISPDTVFPLLFGFATGIVSGLLPGVGILSFTILCWPLLNDWNVIQCLSWFMASMITAQFVGSVVATHFGILGETSSYTATVEGFRLFQQGRGPIAIKSAAIGSLIATVIALIIFSSVNIAVDWIASWYRTSFQVLIVVLVLIATCFISPEKSWISRILQIATGLSLGTVGQHSMYDFTVDLEIIKIDQSLPLIPLLAGLYILPNLVRNHQTIAVAVVTQVQNKVEKFTHWTTAIFYSFVGFLFGLTPGLTTDIASNVSYKLQQYREKRKQTYDSNGSVGCVTAAETANNAAAISCMLPLLLFGVPITVSESLLYSIISTKGHVFSLYNFNTELIVNLLIGLSAVGALSYVISGSLSELLIKFYLWLRHKTMWLIGALLLFAVVWTGINEYSLQEYVATLILGLVIAGIFWRTNFYILIFAFAISSHAVENLIRLKFLL